MNDTCESQGIGIDEILAAVVERIPPPQNTIHKPLRALIFDSYYDSYKVRVSRSPSRAFLGCWDGLGCLALKATCRIS